MRPIEELLSSLENGGLKLWVDGEVIRFRGSPAAGSEADIAELKSRKAEAMACLRLNLTPKPMPKLTTMERPERIPLSLPQWLWFPREDRKPAFEQERITQLLRLEGKVNIPILRQAVARVFRRHEVLRTRYPSENGTPWQQIDPDFTPEIDLIDFSHLSEEEAEFATYETLRERRRKPVDLALDPAYRGSLFKLADEVYILAGLINHIAFDLSSVPVYYRDLFGYYHCGVLGLPMMLPPLKLQYADFALWETTWLSGEYYESNTRFWDEKLKDVPPLELPKKGWFGAQSPAKAIAFDLPEGFADRLEAFAKSRGLTPTMLVLATCSVLFSRWSSQDKVLFGYVINGRPSSMADQVGCFIRSRPFYIDHGQHATFEDLLEASRRALIDATNVRHPTGPNIMHGKNMGRIVVDISPLPDVSAPMETKVFGLKRLTWRLPRKLITHVTQDFQVRFHDGAKFLGYVAYATDRIDEAPVRWFLDEFPRFLGRAMDDPAASMRDLAPPPVPETLVAG